jgi:three-Cys-motif partner protein
MPDRHPTIWQLERHTRAKHEILRKYLGAWLPKLAWAKRLVFIDGFAGPGEYAGGEPGSPLIALHAAMQHKADLSGCELVYIFIEEDKLRFEHLARLIQERSMPDHIRCEAVQGTFADHLAQILDTLDEAERLAPAFVMVDPFGFAGLPLELLARVAQYQRSELLISFMYESIVRWRSQPQLATTLDGLFGCQDWRRADDLLDPAARKDFLLNLYVRQLRDVAGMEYRRAFEMIDSGNRTEYFLIFATHHLEGLKAMKAAMWAVDPSGSYQFSDATVPNQLTLFQPQPDFDLLKRLVLQRFRGQDVSILQLERFVVVETAFRETHFRTRILTPMEKNGELSVVETTRKRGRGYPPGTVIRFP